MNITIQEIQEKDLKIELFSDFNRFQDVKKAWRKEAGEWVLKDICFQEHWSGEDYLYLIECLKGTIAKKGKVYGAFENKKLVGFASVEREPFGSGKQYVQLTSLHVTFEKRGTGIGKQLYEAALSAAAGFGAKKLYISAHSAQETQAFYKAMGCVEAKEYDQKAVELEPCDCQLECEIKQENC